MSERRKAYTVLAMNTLAFATCFAVWMMNGVLVTFLVENGVFAFSETEMGWLIGTPVLTGAVLRLPAGILTDRFGGRVVTAVIMLVAAASAFLTSQANGFWGLILGGLGFGVAGASFAAGVAYTSLWFPDRQQGTALGIYGTGATGAAITSMTAPTILEALTNHGAHLEGWRQLPQIYAAALVAMTILFWAFTHSRRLEGDRNRGLLGRLEPLKVARVWRFGLYYFLAFGGFVALAQWLIPYFVNVYTISVASAGFLAAVHSLPSGAVRAVGGWLSDRVGARAVLYWSFSGIAICSLLLIVPRLDVYTPGPGIMARASGTASTVSADRIVVGDVSYNIRSKPDDPPFEEGVRVWPMATHWHEPIIAPGDRVARKQLLARGVTHIHFQANLWILTGIVFVLGVFMGLGMAAVYKHIPTYFPQNVGTVGGIVGVLGGLGGFFGPIAFGYLLRGTGLWTTCWMVFFVLAATCLAWMHRVVRRMEARPTPLGGSTAPSAVRVPEEVA